jgi:hypothetical protein
MDKNKEGLVFRILRNLLILATFLATAAFSQSYTTNFSATENPISEGGKWTNGGAVGIDFRDVQTANGRAYSSGIVSGYDDCIACLSGYPANQSVQATIYRDPSYTAPSTHEVELHLRTTITAKSIRTYEMDFWFAGSTLQIVRWNGQVGDFTVLNATGPGLSSLVTGDVIKAQISGSTITVYKNGNLIATCTDNVLTSGNPGMGFFVRPGGTLDKFCISSLTAAALGTGIEGPGAAGIAGFQLLPCTPNPFRQSGTIRFNLAEPSKVLFEIFDPSGRAIRTLENGTLMPGAHRVIWDGADQMGIPMTGGVYFARVRAGSENVSQRLLLMQ